MATGMPCIWLWKPVSRRIPLSTCGLRSLASSLQPLASSIVAFRSITTEGCMLDFAIRVAQDAGRLLRDRVGTTIDIGHKGAINIVTDVDLASERLIREAIASHYPRHQVLG